MGSRVVKPGASKLVPFLEDDNLVAFPLNLAGGAEAGNSGSDYIIQLI